MKNNTSVESILGVSSNLASIMKLCGIKPEELPQTNSDTTKLKELYESEEKTAKTKG